MIKLFRNNKAPSAQVDPARLPRHVAVIMDGNGRWAKKRGLPRTVGHAAGAEAFRRIANYSNKIGIEYLTVYAFSTENWKRPPDEVEAIMGILEKYLHEAIETIRRDGVRMFFFGDLSVLSPTLRALIDKTEDVSRHQGGAQVNMCVNYGGRDEILRAVRRYAADHPGADTPVTEEEFSQYMYSAGIPDPDLVIRPSGEMRLSNFLLWQSAYSEFYFTDVLWPDFNERELDRAIIAFQGRDRRYGGVKGSKNMKTRIIVAAVFVPLVFVVLFFLPAYATAAFISLISAVAACELIRASGPPAVKRLYVYAAVSALALPVAVLLELAGTVYYIALFALVTVVFAEAVFHYQTAREINLVQVAAAIFGGGILPLFIAAVVRLRLNGSYAVLLPFVSAFITDAGAYFVGVFLGKRRAFPHVSPKKTIEGSVGGIVVGVAAMIVYGMIVHYAAGLRVSYPAMLLYGAAGGVATELGDLVFSLIKRVFAVKDYGRVLPGHGGILDRFDSMFFAAPVILILFQILPVF